MKQIQIKPLSREGFRKYGEFQDLLNDGEMAEKSIFQEGFFADLIKLDLGADSLPTVSVCQVRQQEVRRVSMLEAHRFTCEGLLPLDSDIIIFAGTPYPGEKFTVDRVEAFYVPQGTFVKLNPLILHGTQFPVGKEIAHVLCLLPGRTFWNDMLAEVLPEGEQGIIV